MTELEKILEKSPLFNQIDEPTIEIEPTPLNKDAGRDRRKRNYAALLDTWAGRHGLTRKQVLSIILNDSPFAGPNRPDAPTYKDLFVWAEGSTFAAELLEEIEPQNKRPDLTEDERIAARRGVERIMRNFGGSQWK